MRFTRTGSAYKLIRAAVAASVERPDPLRRKLNALKKLPHGWSNGEGSPVTEEAARIAESFIDIGLRLQLRTDLFPGIHGDCAVTFYEGDRSVEVIVPRDGGDHFGLHVEKGTGFEFSKILEKDDASHAEVVKEIVKLVSEVWKLPASSPYGNLTETSADFQMWSSSTHLGSHLIHPTKS